MSDEIKPLNLPEETENQDLPANTEQDSLKKGKSGRIRKGTRSSSNKDQDLKEQAAPPSEDLDSTDDLLADIRRSLVEEDISKREKKQKGIFQRVSKAIKPGKASPKDDLKDEKLRPDEIDTALAIEDVQEIIKTPAALSSGDENTPAVEEDKTSHPDTESESVENTPLAQDVLKNILGIEIGELIPEKPQDELIPQPEMVANTITEKTEDSNVFPIQSEKEKIEDRFENIREVALEGYSESPLQSESVPAVSWGQTFKAFLSGLKPLERVLIFSAISLIFIAGMIGFGFRIINAQIPEETPVPVAEQLPFPVQVTLPGGWDFNLAKGKVANDKWSPAGPEWLEGTELCRWVALPWSTQLEAVVRTLRSNDPIELTMSNADELQYKVESIHKVSVDQIDTLDTTTACLLLILVNEDTDSRWVVTAKP